MVKDNFNLKKVGERLKTVRTELGLSQLDFRDLLPQNQIQVTISRLEAGQGANAEVVLLMLNYYYEKGYNLEWFIADDNSNILKKKDIVYSFDIDKKVLTNKITIIDKEFKEIKKILNDL